jgi:hypothetical protein
MSDKLVFGYERLKDDGDPIDNCIDYVFQDWKICDCGNIFLGMIQKMKYNFIRSSKREWENVLVDIKNIDDIKDIYYYLINIREFTASLGVERMTGKVHDMSVFEHINEKVLKDCRNNKCKIILNYGYEGFGREEKDTILYNPLLDRLHFLLDKYDIPHKNVVYIDSNTILDNVKLNTDIYYFSYEYCGLDWNRYTIMHPSMTYHGNSKSLQNLKRWKKTRDEVRKKYFLSFNRLPKQHRVDLVLTLEKYNLLDKGYVSFPAEKERGVESFKFWEWTTSHDLKLYESELRKKLPLKIDDINLSDLGPSGGAKWSFEKIDLGYYLSSYFQIVTENQFTSRSDQVSFTEKVWKPITNFQPFILLGDRYQLKKLREWGFKTFSPFIDESYDEVLDIKERFSMIEIEINKLCNRPIEEIHDWYWSIEQDLRHNYYHFYGKWIRTQRNKLMNGLR